MGNSTVGFAYDIIAPIEYVNNNHWLLNEGIKKEDKEIKEKVSIFKFSKANTDKLILAQRHIQKLRTVKHPYILSFIDSADIEDSLVLVTESVMPIELWLKNNQQNNKNQNNSNEQQQAQVLALIWGFKCILMALDFLHTKCSTIHGNLGLHSIFVTNNGDWKLGNLELSCNPHNKEDFELLTKYQNMLNKPYFAPERSTLQSSGNLPSYIDIYSMGHCIQKSFNDLNLEIPRALNKHLTLMTGSDYRKRPQATQLVNAIFFNSENIKMLESINELTLKSNREVVDLLAQLEPKIGEISDAICIFKILPSISKTLHLAVNEFANRDSRELCRQNVQLSLTLLSKMASLGKLDEGVFISQCLPTIIQLWTMTDRSVRTALLLSLKQLAGIIPTVAMNKTVFDHIITGFSDSNSKMRENTLMSMLYVVDKLEGTQLQEKLVRCITNLQSDVEATIRTNATIFLGKIANKLKETVRVRVLCNAFTKAMKDNFTHCRIAGLKTSQACIKLLDIPQLVSKLIPTASLLLLDKSSEVRSLSLNLIETSLEVIRVHHEKMLLAAPPTTPGGTQSTEGPNATSTTQPTSTLEGTANVDQNSSLLGSWSLSVLQGLSKTIETATGGPTPVDDVSKRIGNITITKKVDLNNSNMQMSLHEGVDSAMNTSQKSTFGLDGGWDDDFDDLDIGDEKKMIVKNNAMDKNEDEDDDMLDSDSNWMTSPTTPIKKATSIEVDDDDNVRQIKSLSLSKPTLTESIERKAKVSVAKKLSKSDSNEDRDNFFSDMNSSISNKKESNSQSMPIKKEQTTSSVVSPDTSNKIIATKDNKIGSSAKKAPKVAVKKLAINKGDEAWEDF